MCLVGSWILDCTTKSLDCYQFAQHLVKHLAQHLVKHLAQHLYLQVYLKVEIPAIKPIQAKFVTIILITAHPNCSCWNN